jgi:membrane protease YdiL (CAAX protease family)
VWLLGWWKEAGLTVTTKDNHLLWILLLMAMMPILLFGTIETPASFTITYGIILFLTSVGEEILNRGVILRALWPLTVAPQRVHPIE